MLDVLCQYLFGVPTVVVEKGELRTKDARRAEIAAVKAARRVRGVDLKQAGEGVENLAPVGGGVTKQWLAASSIGARTNKDARASTRAGESEGTVGDAERPNKRGRGA